MSETPYEGAPIEPEEDGSYDCRVCKERVTSGDFADLIQGTCGKERCSQVVNRAVSFKTARTKRIMNTPVEEFFRATEPVEVEETPEEAAERIHKLRRDPTAESLPARARGRPFCGPFDGPAGASYALMSRKREPPRRTTHVDQEPPQHHPDPRRE